MFWLLLTALAAPPDVDPVSLAGLLLRDGHWDRATTVLEAVDPEAEGDLDLPRFYALRGLVRLNGKDYAAAGDDLEQSVALGAPEAIVHVHLARARIGQGDGPGALAALDAGGDAVLGYADTYRLRARVYRDAGNLLDAWAALDGGIARFPDDLGFQRDQVMLLIDLGLFQEALTRGRAYLAKTADDPTAWVAVAQAMRAASRHDEARLVLEEAHLRFPEDVDILAGLARVYLDTDHPLAAGILLEQAAVLDPELAELSAECFRQAGDLDRALYMNHWVPAPDNKAKQRLGILLDQQHWSRAVALSSRLERLELLEDDGIAYALAYARFQVGDLDGAEGLLKTIDDPALFQDAAGLRQAMADCEAAGWTCF